MPSGRSAAPPLVTERPLAALGLVVGPAAFIAGWAIAGSRMPDGYSPVTDAISRTAAVGAPSRALMTRAFVVYGGAVVLGSTALRTSLLRRGWWLAAVNGAATFAVAMLPLDRSAALDRWHGVAAGVGYASITALPLVSAAPLRASGRPRATALSVAAGVASGACLVATTVSEQKGFFQRAGLTIGDAWLIATGVAMWTASRRRAVGPSPG